MSKSLLRLNGVETACVFAAVSKEVSYLKDDIESGELSEEEKAQALVSVSVCQSVLSKLTSQPGAIYKQSE